MFWLFLSILILWGLFFLSIKIEIFITYESAQLNFGIYLLVGKKKYLLPLHKLVKNGENISKETGQKSNFAGLKKCLLQIVEENKKEIVSIFMQDLQVYRYCFHGLWQNDGIAMKSILGGILSCFSWYLYSFTSQWLIWKKQPDISIFWGAPDTKWEFCCMVGDTLGHLFIKCLKILLIILKRSVKNGAKERNRSAHANGYL